MKFFLALLFLTHLCLGQSFLIWPLLDQSSLYASNKDPHYRLLWPENLADTNKLVAWHYSGVDYYARDIEYPDSLDMFDQKHVVGVNADAQWGNATFALGVERVKEAGVISYKKDSLSIKGNFQNADTLVSCFISYKNRFFYNRVTIQLSLLPVMNLGRAVNSEFDKLRIDNSLYAAYSFMDKATVFCFFCEHLKEVSSQCDILQLASQGIFFNGVAIGNQINFNYRTTTKTQTARAGANIQVRSGRDLRLSYQEDRVTPGTTYFLQDYALINGKSTTVKAQLRDSISPWFSYLIDAWHEEYYYTIQAKYRRENGSYSSLIPQMKTEMRVDGVEVVTDVTLSPQVAAGSNVTYKRRGLSFPEYASMSMVKLTMISYGLYKFSVDAMAQQFSAGAHLEFRTKTGTRFFAASEYTYQKIDGTAHLYDTWTLHRDTIGTPLRGVHLMNFEITARVKICPRLFCDVLWNQTVPVRFDVSDDQWASGESGIDGGSGNNSTGGGGEIATGGSEISSTERPKQLFGLARISASISYEY